MIEERLNSLVVDNTLKRFTVAILETLYCCYNNSD